MSRARSAIWAGGLVGEFGDSRPTLHPVPCRISRGRFYDGKTGPLGYARSAGFKGGGAGTVPPITSMIGARNSADGITVSAEVANPALALQDRLEAMMRKSGVVREILTRAPRLQLPDWYLGAGGIAQTVWDELHGFAPGRNIKDYDLVYFDSSVTSRDAEESHARDARRLLVDVPAELDVANEARVHPWYSEPHGYGIAPYTSVEDGIASWPTTATAIGVRREEGGHVTTYTPFDLEDLFGRTVRPPKRQITKAIYDQKIRLRSACWPRLTVGPSD